MLSELGFVGVFSLWPWVVRFSLLGHELVRVCSSQGMDWGTNISLKAWIGAAPSLFEAKLSLLGIGQSQHVSDALSLNPGYLAMCTHSAVQV